MNGKDTRLYDMRGFTLVEILVALTLFGLVLSMIFSGLHAAGKSWAKSEAQIAENDASRLDLGFIRKQMSELVPLVLQDGKENPVLFRGDHDAIRFISDLPGHRGGGGLYLLSLSITRNGDGKDLELNYEPVTENTTLENLDAADDVKSITVLKDLDLLEFSYFGSKDDKTDPAWSDEWKVKRRLPDLVRMHVETVKTTRFIPDIIVQLHTVSSRGQPQLILYKGNSSQDTGNKAAGSGVQPETVETKQGQDN